MLTDVTLDVTDINLMPTSEAEEIIQNVRCILATQKFTVPLDRSFGIDGKFLDEPISTARARAVSEITSAVNEQEPRARVKKIFFDGNETGRLSIRVRIEI